MARRPTLFKVPRHTLYNAVLFVPAAPRHSVTVGLWAYDLCGAQVRIWTEIGRDARIIDLVSAPTRPGVKRRLSPPAA